MEPIRRLNRVLKYQGKIVNFYEDEVQLPNGNKAYWDYIEHPRCAAAVIPVREDGKILMVRQYRNALDRFTLEIPAGGRDSIQEPTKVCAARELEEETGYRSDHLEKLITIRTTVAFCNEFIDIYVADHLEKTRQHLDEDEFVDVEAYTPEELEEKIYACEIQDSKTVAGITAYINKCHKKI